MHKFHALCVRGRCTRKCVRVRAACSPVKAKTRLSAGKCLGTCFETQGGVFQLDFLFERRMLNAVYYCYILEDAKNCLSQRTMLATNAKYNILHHDNARTPYHWTNARLVENFTVSFWSTLLTTPIYRLANATCLDRLRQRWEDSNLTMMREQGC